jgi:hypothetical protein
MGLEEFETPGSAWMEEVKSRTEERGLLFDYIDRSSKCELFLIEGDKKYVTGKTHHCRAKNRDKPYISLNSVEEAKWRENPQNIPFSLKDDYEVVDIFGVVVDHRSSNGYQQEQDNFLVLTEDTLDDIPQSGKKNFSVWKNRYRDPYGKYKNCWERIFKNID